jgi:ribosomal protein L11 methyltransferase
MSYRELVVELAREHAEALSDALLDLGALSVSVEDADADTPDEQPLFGEPGLEPAHRVAALARGRAAVARSRTGRAARGGRERDRHCRYAEVRRA